MVRSPVFNTEIVNARSYRSVIDFTSTLFPESWIGVIILWVSSAHVFLDNKRLTSGSMAGTTDTKTGGAGADAEVEGCSVKPRGSGTGSVSPVEFKDELPSTAVLVSPNSDVPVGPPLLGSVEAIGRRKFWAKTRKSDISPTTKLRGHSPLLSVLYLLCGKWELT